MFGGHRLLCSLRCAVVVGVSKTVVGVSKTCSILPVVVVTFTAFAVVVVAVGVRIVRSGGAAMTGAVLVCLTVGTAVIADSIRASTMIRVGRE